MLQRDLRAIAFRSTGMVAGVLAETMGGGIISYEMLLLPLAGDNGAAGAIGSMVRIGGHDEVESHPRPHRRAVAALDPLPARWQGRKRCRDTPQSRAAVSAGDLGMRRRYGH